MAITRTLDNGQLLTDWTEEVNDIANQYGVINGSGLFSGSGTSQLTLLFDKATNQINLLNQTNRNSNKAEKGANRLHQTFSLVLPYFLYQDRVTAADIQGLRMPGTPDSPETLARVVSEKLEDMRLVGDQTREYMKIQALKGITQDPAGNNIADMFQELNLANGVITDPAYDFYEQRFNLADPTVNPDIAISELKRNVAKGAQMGGRIGTMEAMVTPGFFDRLVTHPLMREAYLHYKVDSPKSDSIRADLQTYADWGVVDMFEHHGILFWTYDAEFTLDDGDGTVTLAKGIGSTSRDTRQGAIGALQGVLADGTFGTHTGDLEPLIGYTVIKGAAKQYRGVFGPANTLTGANQFGSEMMVSQYTDPRDKFWELELEMSPLYYIARPQLSYRLYDSV